MAALKHMRHVERGTPHLHHCMWCKRWKTEPLCTDPKCDIVGCYPLEGDPLGGHSRSCSHCRAEYAHECALKALRRFGEAIATVARARLVARAMDGRAVEIEVAHGSERRRWAAAPTYNGGWSIMWIGGLSTGEEVARVRGPREDTAAEVVDTLLRLAAEWSER